MNKYADLKIGKLVQTVLKPLIISKASFYEVTQMEDLEYSKKTFGIQYPLLLKTDSSVAEKHYYSELLTLYGETYRLCCEWFETSSNNDRPYVEQWIREHENVAVQEFFPVESKPKQSNTFDWSLDDFFDEPKKNAEILPKNGTVIAEGQYKNREDLTVVEIPEGVVYIGRDAFAFCKNLKEIVIPDSVVGIDEAAFYCCSALENIQLPKNLRYLGGTVFANCTCLQRINIPSQITIIPMGCFSGCTSLKEVQIRSDLRVIMDLAFYNCASLSSFSLYCNEHLHAIFSQAFIGCKNLVFETIDQDVSIANFASGALGSSSVMIDKNAFDWKQLTIRTFKGTAGDKLAQKLGLKVEYVKDKR